MKFSLALALVILVVAAGFGWRDHRRIVAARDTHQHLAAEAASRGIAVTDPTADGGVESARLTKRQRESSEADARLVAADLIAFAKELEAIQKAGGEFDESFQQRIIEYLDRLLSLDAANLKILIAGLRADRELKDNTRNGLIGLSVMTLANDHPQAALALIGESEDFFKIGGMGGRAIGSALAQWAKDDPLAALDWLRSDGAKHPDLVNEEAKRGLLAGTAAHDPGLAFKLIGELGIKDANASIEAIVAAARSPDQRSATLAALRSHLATLTDEATRGAASRTAVSALFQGAAGDGFDSASQWLDSAQLSPTELQNLAIRMPTVPGQSGETGRWIEWLDKSLPADEATGPISRMVGNWTQTDYQAAGEWLAATPDGPARNIAIGSYAQTVARYEPAVAAQWALLLPPGQVRDATMADIQRHWSQQDPEAAAAFAKQQGLK